MTHRFLYVLCGLVAVAAPSAPQQADWKDPSPHVVKFVEVDTGVRLEVLDWGGSGPALLLLAGGGDTAHVFDDLAPTLAKRHRVVGVTRRGHPGSSAPATGYGVARLAEDIVRVMDAVSLKTPVVAGHSFAGEEMHVLGARYATRIAGLVYVDAAFDRGDDADSEAFNAVARTLPTAPSPKEGGLASFTALRAHLEKYGGAGPEAHLQADDPAVRERIEKLFLLTRERVRKHEKWFEAFAEQERVVELSGTHHLLISNPREVVEQIDAFTSRRVDRR